VVSAQKIVQSPVTAGLLVGTLVFLVIFGLQTTGNLESIELAAYDWLIRFRPLASNWEPPVVLVKITEDDIHKQGRWPISDATLAQVLATLVQYQPRVIGLDIYRDIPVPPGREELDAVLANNPQIVAVMKFGGWPSRGISPPSVLKDSDQVGFADIVVDPGGIVRRGLLFLDDGERIFSSFALQSALLYLQAEGIAPQPDSANPEHIRLGETTIRPFGSNDGSYVDADSRGYQFLLDFRDPQKAFTTYTLSTLISGKIEPERIRDQVVLIGVTAESVKDFFYVPMNPGLRPDRQISGTELHGHIVSQLLRFGLKGDQPVSTVSDWWERCWILLWSLMGATASIRVRSTWRFTILAIGGLAVLSFAVFLAFGKGLWIPWVSPATAWLMSSSIIVAHMVHQEKKQRGLLMQLFSRHVSKEIANAVWEEKEDFLDGGRPRPQRLMATVLFTDLIGFTSVSEKLDPQMLMRWLNEYMEAMAEQVVKHGGIINKYIGDAIMTVFGVPLARKTEAEIGKDAANAVNCALAMESKLIQLNSTWKERHLPTIGMRIGVFTGPLVAGSLGSAERLEYTVIGDTVNVASRLESFDKSSFDPDLKKNTCRILIGEATYRYIEGQFKTQRVGEVNLKGQERKTTIYSVKRQQE
jgi:adenylate cyclase